MSASISNKGNRITFGKKGIGASTKINDNVRVSKNCDGSHTISFKFGPIVIRQRFEKGR